MSVLERVMEKLRGKKHINRDRGHRTAYLRGYANGLETAIEALEEELRVAQQTQERHDATEGS